MVSQLLVNAFIAASVYALVGAGFALLFRVVHFFHFTYGFIYSLGAYITFALNQWLQIPFLLAIPLSLITASLTGLLFEASVFARLREKGASPLISLLASIGLYLIGQNVLSVTFGDGVLSIRPYEVAPGIHMVGASITLSQLIIIASSIAVIGVTTLWLSRTRQGRQIQAVADNCELAAIVGIPVPQVMRTVVMVGSAIGGLASVLSALDRDMVPTMGMNALLVGVVVIIVGGQNSMVGVTLAGLLVALAQNLSILWIPSAWQDAIAFLILILFLLLRPQGFLGKPLRRAAV